MHSARSSQRAPGPARVAVAFAALAAGAVAAQERPPQEPSPPTRQAPGALVPPPQMPWPTTTRLPGQPAPILVNPLEQIYQGGQLHPRFRRGDLPGAQGLPVLTPPGFGAYPGGALPIPFVDTGVPLPAVPPPSRSANRWPSWIGMPEGAGEEDFPADAAVVAQATDYVWIREPDAGAFVPLTHWDRFRVVREGHVVDLRRGGQFELLCQRGAVLRVLGRARLVVGALGEERSPFVLEDLTRLVATAQDRPLELRIGHAGTLEFASARLSLQRERGMVHCTNVGPGTATFRAGERELELPAGHRLTLFPDAPPSGIPHDLELLGDVSRLTDGRTLRIEAGPAGGSASWSGARFDLGAGSVLRIDPLAGDRFPPPLDS